MAETSWTQKVWNPMPEALDQPLRWKKPRRIFVNSMSDLFHENVPFEFIYQVFDVMRRVPHHTFQVLTKRPERMRNMLLEGWTPPPNIWLGVSAENQATADERIPLLLQTPAAVRFVSLEPLLGPINIETLCHPSICGGNARGAERYMRPENLPMKRIHGLDWVVVGGESGSGARLCNIEWIRAIVRQCKAAGVRCFVKQLGSWIAATDMDAYSSWRPRSSDLLCWTLRDRKGGDPSEWPEDLRVREFPK